MGVVEAAESEGIDRRRVWDWRQSDSVFQDMLDDAFLLLSEELVNDAVAMALARARSLTPKALDRIEKGLNITHVAKAMTVSLPAKQGSKVEIVDVPDDRAAAEIALQFLRHIQEFQPKQEMEHSGVVRLEDRIAAREARRKASGNTDS
jgi:hypothetical protein